MNNIFLNIMRVLFFYFLYRVYLHVKNVREYAVFKDIEEREYKRNIKAIANALDKKGEIQ